MEIWNQFERRRHIRIRKNYFISFFEKADPARRHDATQLKDISLGGMCFITSRQYGVRSKMRIELKTPYTTDTIPMDAHVVFCQERFANKMYETHVEFEDISTQAEWALKQIIEKALIK